MDKLTFLEELKKSLRVLKEEELQDIVAEYDQHIDMKVKSGLTVEQAIADFGNVKELASEILEAYHVRAEYSIPDEPKLEDDRIKQYDIVSKNNTEEKEESEQVQEKRTIISKGFEGICNIGTKIGVWISLAFCWFWNGCRWFVNLLKRPFHWIKEKWSGLQALRTQKKLEKVNNETLLNKEEMTDETFRKNSIEVHAEKWFVKVIKGMARMIQKTWNWIAGASLWCLRICWNCCVIGTALMVGSFGLMCLFATGVLGVFWLQGYPFAGLTIGCLGLVFSLFAGTALIWTLIWNRTKKACLEAKTSDVQVVEVEEGLHA